LEFFQVQEESAQAQEGAQQPSDRLEKEIWTIGFYVQEEKLRRSTQKNGSRPLDLESRNYPSAIRSDRSCTRFNPSGIAGISAFVISGISRT
jgi:hypothetical protein